MEYLVLAYSATKSKEFFGKTCLVTDAYGKELMEEFGMSGLFDEILVELDECKDTRFWAAGKIWAYTNAIKEFEPFIMMDNDAGFRERPPEHYLKSLYRCQHIHVEKGSVFEPLLKRIVSETKYEFPYDIYHDAVKQGAKGGNSGFIVMNDKETWELFKKYTWAMMQSPFMDKIEQEFVKKGERNIYKAMSYWNVIVEEVLMLQCYRRVRMELPQTIFEISGFDFPAGTPNPTNYFHIWGSKREIERLKRDEKIAVDYIDKTISERIYKYFKN